MLLLFVRRILHITNKWAIDPIFFTNIAMSVRILPYLFRFIPDIAYPNQLTPLNHKS